MNYKVLALGALLGFMVALSPSCGPADCSAANCNGCCSADGKTCTETATQNATVCGASGSECKACAATETCTSGVCTPVTTGNTDSGMPDAGGTACNGMGCRTAAGVCLGGTSTSNCGTGGLACKTCAMGETCTSGACVAPPPIKLGSACTSDPDCGGNGLTCRIETTNGKTPYPEGYCTRACASHTDCGANGSCVGLGRYGEGTICTVDCGPDPMTPNCRAGYECYVTGGQMPRDFCWLDPLPMYDAGSPPPDNLIGSACLTNDQCSLDGGYAQGECIPPVDTLPDGGVAMLPDGGGPAPTGWTDGYCTGDCSVVECGTTAECFIFGSGASSVNLCLDLCPAPLMGQGDCRTGYVCDDVPGFMPGVCFPACNAPGRGCPTGQNCNDAGYCM